MLGKKAYALSGKTAIFLTALLILAACASTVSPPTQQPEIGPVLRYPDPTAFCGNQRRRCGRVNVKRNVPHGAAFRGEPN
ncbi:MAG: hypothetical protein LBG73_03595 [Spirochaetaceae bacterium]|nr:hypothetical protein [Spirochaetaceae bacterium]